MTGRTGARAVLLAAAAALVAAPPASGQPEDVAAALRHLESTLSAPAAGLGAEPGARIVQAGDGLVRHLAAPAGGAFRVVGAARGRPEETARAFLREHRAALAEPSARLEFALRRSRRGEGRDYVRFRQTYGGLRVFAAEAVVQVRDDGGVEYAFFDLMREARALERGALSTSPTLTAGLAAARALETVAPGAAPGELAVTDPELALFDPRVLGSAGELRLVWDLRVSSRETTLVDDQVLVDAHSGEIVRRYPRQIPALNREIFDGNNTTSDPGTLRRAEGDPAAAVTDVNNAYDFLGDAYDFYASRHGRDSIDDGGMTLSATVRHCSPSTIICGSPPQCPCGNSFWSPSRNRMYFGDGEVVDDVVGHEYTHGVTSRESDLVYENESGAINESFSDIWGEFIDLSNGAGTDTAAARWQLFEDTGSASRNMQDPTRLSQPDRKSSPLWFSGTDDHGGVHTNSGVGNKLAYLLTDGDTFNGQTVDGMGIDRVARLFWEVQANLLTSGADYFDLYHQLRQAAVNRGWSVHDQNNIHRACLAVEIAQPRQVYVDGAAIWPLPDGSQTFPYRSIAEGKLRAFPGDGLNVRPGNYPETITLDEISVLRVWGTGTVTIGQP